MLRIPTYFFYVIYFMFLDPISEEVMSQQCLFVDVCYIFKFVILYLCFKQFHSFIFLGIVAL